MYEYTGPDDNMRFSNLILEPAEVIRATKRLLGESREKISQVGLAPFWANNLAHEVRAMNPFCFLFSLR